MFNPRYTWSNPKNLLFMTGAPLSGKSTLAALVTAAISNCHLQAMDLVRLFAQELERAKDDSKRNPFVSLGSCDSFTAIGDGTYTPARLLDGFRAYAEAVCQPLFAVLPALEPQGVQDLLIEGVQLMPMLVAPWLRDHHALIVVVTESQMFNANRERIFGRNPMFEERYATDRLLLIQEELLRQARLLLSRSVIIVHNTRTIEEAVSTILEELCRSGRIRLLNAL